jgi:hypothetical protein|tara:strand:+ start:692 stop:952 length:261 start_codon:yes stop_codon:yes gene_type:complete
LNLLEKVHENKKPITNVMGFLVRRARDSNPWRCDPQQFSRLPHSTTLPALHCGANIIGFWVFQILLLIILKKIKAALKWILIIFVT